MATVDNADLVSRLLDVIQNDIAPVTRQGVLRGNKLFGAAILLKSDLSVAELSAIYQQDKGQKGIPLA